MYGERSGLVVEARTPEWEVRGFDPHSGHRVRVARWPSGRDPEREVEGSILTWDAVLCPWAKLICAFVFAYAKIRFSYDAAQMYFICNPLTIKTLLVLLLLLLLLLFQHYEKKCDNFVCQDAQSLYFYINHAFDIPSWISSFLHFSLSVLFTKPVFRAGTLMSCRSDASNDIKTSIQGL